MDESPYSKREQDEWRSEIRAQLTRIEDLSQSNAKTNAELARIASHNSGQIIALWKSMEEALEASKFLKDMHGFWNVTRWFIGFIVSVGVLFTALKVIASVHVGKLLDLFK